MDTKFQTSFIPKQPVTATAPRTSSGSSIFLLLAIIIFVATLVTSGGLYLYDQKLQSDIKTGSAQLAENQNSFQQVTLDGITRLNDRIDSIAILLKKHISFSNFFANLELSTLQTVRFSTMSYVLDPMGKVQVTMNGQALNYDAVALQEKALISPSLDGAFQNPVFGNLNLDASGNVTFNLMMTLNPSSISYYKSIQDAASGANGQSTVPVAAPVSAAPVNSGNSGLPADQAGQGSPAAASVTSSTTSSNPNQ